MSIFIFMRFYEPLYFFILFNECIYTNTSVLEANDEKNSKLRPQVHNQIIVLFYWVGYAFSIIRSKSSMSQKLIELKLDCYFYYTYPIVSKGRVNKSGPILPPLGYSLQGKKKRERTQRNKLFTEKRERRDASISFSSP